MRDGLSSWCAACHRHAVYRSQAKAKARKLLEKAELEEERARELESEWYRRRAERLREEAHELLANAA